jgi:iron complex outermembrane recepter protein
MNKINKTRAEMIYRHKLLATVSATALLGLVYGTAANAGTDADRPLVWIELDGHLDRVSSPQEPYLPPFDSVGVQHGLLSVGNLQASPRFSIGEGGSISFQPENSDWIFSASVQIGRSGSNRHHHQQVTATTYISPDETLYIYGPNNFSHLDQTADYTVKSSEKHAILDFEVRKDVGLGMWGGSISSQIALGVRFAQFTSTTSMNLRADPYPHRDGAKYVPAYHASIPFNVYYQFYKARPTLDRNFRGVGPSLSWKGSIPVVRSNGDDTEVTFDWGANVGVLFGRQKVKIQHHTTADRYALRPFGPFSGMPKYSDDHYVNSARTVRSHSVIVPNVGGLAGMSFRKGDAKISFGYRADFFFDAMDVGIDARKSETRGFNGPYASISVGLGD